MADPRNIAHDKKVHDEKKHNHEEIAPNATVAPQPGKKTPIDKDPASHAGGEHEGHGRNHNQGNALHHEGDVS